MNAPGPEPTRRPSIAGDEEPDEAYVEMGVGEPAGEDAAGGDPAGESAAGGQPEAGDPKQVGELADDGGRGSRDRGNGSRGAAAAAVLAGRPASGSSEGRPRSVE